MRTPGPPHRYGHVAWCYDALASAYSLGAIDRSKRVHHAGVNRSDRVLYVGAGSGREVARACERGAAVTCVEPSPAMAARLRRTLGHHAERVTIDPRPIEAFDADERFDLVVAHYFLNLFGPSTMPGVLDRLCGFVRPAGHFFVADFKPAEPGAGWFDRALRYAYYRPVNLAGAALGICDPHPIYDYAPQLAERGFVVASRASFAVVPGLSGLYETIAAKRSTSA
jgi:demethylmenaquinone methyltransferase/2-methoxy-6-polyprenyl-1,4-benzoquinol methylase